MVSPHYKVSLVPQFLITTAPSEETQVIQSGKTAATLEPSTVRQSEVAPGNRVEGERKAPKSTQDQPVKAAPADTQTNPISDDNKNTTSQLGSGKEAKPTNPKDQETENKNLKAKKDTATTQQRIINQNANVDPNVKQTGQTKQKGKNQQEQ